MFCFWLFGESLYLNNCPFWYEAIEFIDLNSLVNISKTSKAAKTYLISLQILKAVAQSCSVKKIFFEISQNSQEMTCAKVSFFNKVPGLRPATLLKKSLWHWCFPTNFTKFLRIPFFTEHLRWLLRKFLY